MKRIAVLQSNYIPWKGYFDIIRSVDEFIIYDDTQYTKRDWRNRNLIKTRQGLKWLTIPVKVKGRFTQTVNETRISNNKWAEKHWKAITYHYNKARYFNNYKDIFERAYKKASGLEYLSQVNLLFITVINQILGIETKISDSTEYVLEGDKNQKIISFCRQTGADTYITGPSAKNYLREELFIEAGIELEYFNYEGYSEYDQLFGSFLHNVSIIDLIFSTGEKAKSYLKSYDEHIRGYTGI